VCNTAACRRLDRQLPRHVRDLPYRRDMIEGAPSSHIVRRPGDTVCGVPSDRQDTYDRKCDPGRQRLVLLAIAVIGKALSRGHGAAPSGNPLVLPESPEGQTAWGPT